MTSVAPRFLDTNILLRYFTRDDEEKAAAALSLLLRVQRGVEEVATSPLVIFETVFTLQRSYHVSKEQVRALVEPLIALRGLRLPQKNLYQRALELYATSPLSFADAFNVAYMEQQGLTEVYSWDTDFDHVQGIERVEPDGRR